MKFYYTSEPASPDDLSQFETACDLQLPSDYRQFLMSSNGGVPSLAWFEVPGIGSRRLCGFEPFFKSDTKGLKRLVSDYSAELDGRYLPIATTFDAELVCIDTLCGQIIYTMGCAADFAANVSISYHVLADCFSAYLKSLFASGEADELDVVEVLAKAGTKEPLEYFMRNQGTVDIRSKYGFTLAQHCAGSGNLSLLQAHKTRSKPFMPYSRCFEESSNTPS